MKTIFILVTGVIFTGLVSTSVSANHQERPNAYRHSRHFQTLSPYLGIGVGSGGDEVGRFFDNNGNRDEVRSGGGWLLEGGLALAVDPSTSLRLTTGYQFDIASRTNGDALFDRLRFDLTLLRRFNAHEFGAGVTAHTSVGFSCDINSICDDDVEFDRAIGFTLEYSVKVSDYSRRRRVGDSRGLSLGIRYTGIDYRARLDNISEVTDGDSVTGFIGIVF